MEKYEPRESPLSQREGFNNTGSDIGDALCVQADTADSGSQAPLIRLPAAATSPLFGVTRGIIKNGTTGNLISKGRGLVVVAVSVTPGQRLYALTSGKATNVAPGAGANLSYVGLCMSTTGADERAEVEIAEAGATHQGA